MKMEEFRERYREKLQSSNEVDGKIIRQAQLILKMSLNGIAEILGIHNEIDSQKTITIKNSIDMVKKAYGSIYCRTSDKGMFVILHVDGKDVYITNVTDLYGASNFYGSNFPISRLNISVGPNERGDIISTNYTKTNFDISNLTLFKEILQK